MFTFPYSQLPLYVKLLWVAVLVMFVFWLHPFIACYISKWGTEVCWDILTLRSVLLFMIAIPITLYITNRELIRRTGKGVRLGLGWMFEPGEPSCNPSAKNNNNMRPPPPPPPPPPEVPWYEQAKKS